MICRIQEFRYKDVVCVEDGTRLGYVGDVEIDTHSAQLKSIADQSEADLQVKTPWEVTLTIPHAELAALADGHETLIFRVAKDGTFAILADGEALAVPNATTADISQEPPVAVTEPIEIIPASP